MKGEIEKLKESLFQEIVEQLKAGRAHLGVSGEDLAREQVADMEKRFQIMRKLGFGHADVVVAVPAAWIDVRVMSDLEAVGRDFRRAHGRHMRVATKYMNITRRHFQANGITSYRIVESLGATEGTPAAGAAPASASATQLASAGTAPARRLPKTASPVPLLGLIASVAFLVGGALRVRRLYVA